MKSTKPNWASLVGASTASDFPPLKSLPDKNEVKPYDEDKVNAEKLQARCGPLEAEKNRTLELQRAAEEEMKTLRAEKAIAEKRLNEALKMLVLLQPRQNSSDESVKQAYEEFCQNLEDWADSELDAGVDLEQKVSNVPWTFEQANHLSTHLLDDDLELSKTFPETTANVIMNMVFSFLFETCLSEDRWCCGGSQGEEAFLNLTYEAMAQQNVTGGRAISNRWRAETRGALANIPARAQAQQRHQKWAGNELCRILSKLTVRPMNYFNFYERIVVKSFKLADLLKSSVTQYKFNFPPTSVTRDVPLKLDQISSYGLLDADTGLQIYPGTVSVNNDIAGKLRLCVFPGLNKVQENGSLTPLVKALVVLEKYKPTQDEADVKETRDGDAMTQQGGDVCTESPKIMEQMGIAKKTSLTSESEVMSVEQQEIAEQEKSKDQAMLVRDDSFW